MHRLTVRGARAGSARGLLSHALRLVLLAASLALLWRAEGALEEWQRRAGIELEFKTGLWFSWVVPAVLAGILFGLALWLPRGRSAYRWTRTIVLVLPPLLLLLHYWVVFGLGLDLPGALGQETPFWRSGPQFALAVFVGIGVTSGFAEPDEP
ncbi:MAG TPA: hypothetical protein VE646_09465 [Actinomycetota bacterium]|nr:hypothetical protein [Actinomycetota bacterium]